MKKIMFYAISVLLLSSCTRRDYTFTINDITTTGRVSSVHHIETISVPRVRVDYTRSGIAYR